jgi:hypothetical protein
MGRIYLEKNGKTTVLFNGENITEITPSADTYYVGTDLVTGLYEKLDPNGDIINLEGGGGGYTTITFSEAENLVASSGLTEGAFYKITGVCAEGAEIAIYSGGTDIILMAAGNNIFAKRGLGIFYNPSYANNILGGDYYVWDPFFNINIDTLVGTFDVSENITGDGGQTGTIIGLPGETNLILSAITGDWNTATMFTGDTSLSTGNITGFYRTPTYSGGDKVIWGGYVWENITGSLGSNISTFELDDTNWLRIPYNEIDYNKSIDVIDFEFEYNNISYRNDGNNEVSCTYELIIAGQMDFNMIKAFPWGNSFFRCTLNNASINTLINFNGRFIVDMKLGLLSDFRIDYCGIDMSFSFIELGTQASMYDIIVGGVNGDDTFIEGIYVGNSSTLSNIVSAPNTSFKNIYIAPALEGYNIITQIYVYPLGKFSDIKLLGGSSENYSRINNCLIGNGAEIYNLTLGQNAYIEKITLLPNTYLYDIQLGQNSFLDTIDISDNGELYNVNLVGGTTNYLTNITIGNNSVMHDLFLSESANISYVDMNQNDSTFNYINLGINSSILNITFSGTNAIMQNINTFENVDITNIALGNNAGFSDINIGSDSYVDNINVLSGGTFEIVNIGINSYIENVGLGDKSDFTNIDLGGNSYINQINMVDGTADFLSISVGEGSNINNITLGSQTEFSSISLGNTSTITAINLISDAEIKGVDIGNLALFSDITMSGSSTFNYADIGSNTSLGLINLIDNGNITKFKLGVGLTFQNVNVSAQTINNTIVDVGYNNFPATLDITGVNTMNLSAIQYAGEVTLTSSNATETINKIDNASQIYPTKFKPNTGLAVTFSGTSVGSYSTSGQIIMPTATFVANGTNKDYFKIDNIPGYVRQIDAINYL